MSESEKICVAIRMRPLNEREKSSGQEACFRCLPDQNAIVQLKDGKELDGHFHQYDRSFDETSTTDSIYEYVGKDLVAGVVNGISGTIFAYGQTSSGKTFTMTDVSRMASEDIFRHITESENRQFILKVSFVEIYNENLRDLLSDNNDASINIREDPKRGVYCEATEFGITSFEDITRALKKGITKRTVEATAMNDNSSRSHTIFKIYVESKEMAEPGHDCDGAVLIASLNLVDLAGSESVRHTGAQGQRAKEGGKINQSLLSLSRVIHALSQPGAHVGFRDSKLTRLLQPSLSGEAKMSVICCITPAERFLEETRSTLAFASRAKLVTTHAQVNEVLDEATKIKRLEKEISLLRQLVKQDGSCNQELELQQQLQAEKEFYEKKIERLQLLIISSADKCNEENVDTLNLATSFRNGNSRRSTWFDSSSHNMRSIDIDSLKKFTSLPISSTDSHALMMEKEDSLQLKVNFLESIVIEKDDKIENLKLEIERVREEASLTLEETISKHGDNFCDMEDTLTATIETLESKVTALTGSIDSMNLDLESMNGQTETLVQEKDMLNATIVNLTNTVELLNEDKNVLHGERVKLESILVELKDASDLLIIDKEAKDTTIEMLSNANQLQEATIEKLTASNAMLLESVSSLTSSLESKALKEDELLSRINDLDAFVVAAELKHKTEIDELSLKLIQETDNARVFYEAELFSIREQFASVDATRNELSGTIIEKDSKISSLENDLVQLDEIVVSMETDIATLNGNVESLNSTILELNEALASKNDEIVNLGSQLEAAEAQLEADITMSYTGAAETALEIEELKERMLVVQEQLASAIASAANDSEDLKSTIEKTVARAGEKEEEMLYQIKTLEQSLVAKTNEARDTSEQASVEIISLQKEINALEEVILTLNSDLKLVRATIPPPPSSASSQDMSAQENVKLFHALEHSKEHAAKAAEALNAQLGLKEAELSKYMTVAREFEERAARAEHLLSKASLTESQAFGDEEVSKKKVAQLQTQTDLLKSEKDTFERRLKTTEVELRDVRAAASVNEERLQNELFSATNTLKKLQEGRVEVSSMSDSIKALENRLNAVKQERDELLRSVDALLAEKENLTMERDSLFAEVKLSKAIDGSSEIIENLRAEIKSLEEDAVISMKHMAQRESEVGDLTNRLKKAKEQSDMLKLDWERSGEAYANLQKENEQLKKSDVLTFQLQTQIAENERALEEITCLGTSMQELQHQLSKADNRALELSDMLMDIKNQREVTEQICSELETEKNELSKKLAEAEYEVRSLSVRNDGSCTAVEKAALISELNSLMEKCMENEARFIAAEAKTKLLEKQLSDYDKTSRREQELFAEAAEIEMSTLRQKLEESIINSASSRELLIQLQETQTELQASNASNMTMQDEMFSIRKASEEAIVSKDKRIAHLEASKLTQDQMEKIKVLKVERKKYFDDSKLLKKQLQQLKTAYDERELTLATTAAGEKEQEKVARLTLTLKKVSNQIRDYELIKEGVKSLVESLGIENNNDVSVSHADDASVAEWDLLEGVTRLGEAYTALKLNSANSCRLNQVEDDLAKRTIELMEEIDKKDIISRRLETAKAQTKLSKEEFAELSAENEKLRIRVQQLQSDVEDAKSRAVGSVDAASSELQVLEEENIELMKENKELRRDISALKDQLERAGSIIVPRKITTALTPKKSDSNNMENLAPAESNNAKKNICSVGKQASASKPLLETAEASSKAVRNKVTAKPLLNAVADSEQPGECAQS